MRGRKPDRELIMHDRKPDRELMQGLRIGQALDPKRDRLLLPDRQPNPRLGPKSILQPNLRLARKPGLQRPREMKPDRPRRLGQKPDLRLLLTPQRRRNPGPKRELRPRLIRQQGQLPLRGEKQSPLLRLVLKHVRRRRPNPDRQLIPLRDRQLIQQQNRRRDPLPNPSRNQLIRRKKNRNNRLIATAKGARYFRALVFAP